MTRRLSVIAFALAALVGLHAAARCAIAQIPGTPAIPPPPVAVPAAAPSSGCGLLSLFSACKGTKAACCGTPFGQMLNSFTMPFGTLTGGIIPGFCPTTPSAAALASQGATGAAAQIQQDQAQAKARVAAVEYLATVDCHYYPEAEAALILSLRCDKSECVRWAAAKALGSGCCCTKKTVEALTLTVTCSEKDGNPSETSLRVKVAAFEALQWCLMRVQQAQPMQPELPPDAVPPESPQADGDTPSGVALAAYYYQLDAKPWSDIVTEAEQALAAARSAPRTMAGAPTGKRSLFDLWVRAGETQPPQEAAKTEPERVAMVARNQGTPTLAAVSPAEPTSAHATHASSPHAALHATASPSLPLAVPPHAAMQHPHEPYGAGVLATDQAFSSRRQDVSYASANVSPDYIEEVESAAAPSGLFADGYTSTQPPLFIERNWFATPAQ